jgi:glycine cleavage system H lipoate-binding protein
MSCPFLREGRARYCHAADTQKLILEGPGATSGGRCVSPAFRECSLASARGAQGDRCPYLEEIHVQYCGASPTPKLVPFSESQLSRCGSDGYRFCDSYLALARPGKPFDPPPDLLYAPNHLWLEVGQDGHCHVGVDAFLAEVAGTLDGITFATSRGAHRPAVSLSVNGVEWPMRFPNPMIIQSANGQARIDPRRVTADPYGSGWLFEGWEMPGKTRHGLMSGRQSAAWLAEEREHLANYVHESALPGGDGGASVPGVARLLSHTDVVRMFQEFFAGTAWSTEE